MSNNNSKNSKSKPTTDDIRNSKIMLFFDISCWNGNTDPFVLRVKRSAKWSKVLEIFGNRWGIDYKVLRFLYNEERIRAENDQLVSNTIDQNDDEATIYVFLERFGA